MGDELPVVGLDMPVKLDEGLVTVGAHLLQGLPLMDPLHVNPQVKGCTSFILTLITLKVFDFLMNNPKMSQKGCFFLKQLVTVVACKLGLIDGPFMLGNVALVCFEMPLQVF